MKIPKRTKKMKRIISSYNKLGTDFERAIRANFRPSLRLIKRSGLTARSSFKTLKKPMLRSLGISVSSIEVIVTDEVLQRSKDLLYKNMAHRTRSLLLRTLLSSQW